VKSQFRKEKIVDPLKLNRMNVNKKIAVTKKMNNLVVFTGKNKVVIIYPIKEVKESKRELEQFNK